MLRISAFVAVLTLIGAVTTAAWAAPGLILLGAAIKRGCYNSQRCASFCIQHGGNKLQASVRAASVHHATLLVD